MTRIFPLSEGEFTIGHDKVFHPFNTETDVLNERPTGSLLVEVQPFLIITPTDVLLLDTGLGFKKDSVLQLHQNLQAHGIRPEQVTKVLLSHLHKDHAGGVVYENAAGVITPSCPNATYYIYQPEADYALATGYPSYHPAELEPLFASGQVHWLHGESGMIGDNIIYTHSGAHCPQHIVYLIQSEEEKIFFGGDEAPQLKQMKIKYVAKYDYDGKKAMELREHYAADAAKEHWQMLFYHDIKYPTTQF